jgi:hypothetical protein
MSYDIDADLSSLDSGVWHDHRGTKWLIAHISNQKFQRALARLQQPHRKKLQEGTLDPIINRELLCKAMAEGILLGWDGVKQRGVDVPYSVIMAAKLLAKDPDLRDAITEFATDMSHYRDEVVEDLGNG